MVTIKKLSVTRGLICLFAVVGIVVFGSGCTPRGPKSLLKGAQFIRDGKFDKAVAYLQVATREMPTNAVAWNYLGLAYHGNRQLNEAFRAYRQALILDRKLASARYNVGCLFLEQNHPGEAVDELKSFTLLQPRSLDGWLKLGSAHLRVGSLDEAERDFKAALNLEPGNPEAINGIGLVHVQRRRPLDALYYFNNALARNPRYGPALLNLALIAQHQLDNPSLALEKYKEYLALQPRPDNWADVDRIVRQLDARLNPPDEGGPQERTPPAEAATTQRRNPWAASSNETPTRSATSSPTASAPAPAPIIKKASEVEVVTVPEETVVRNPRGAPDRPSATAPGNAGPALEPHKQEKRGFFDRLNPFSTKPGNQTKTAAAPAPTRTTPLTAPTPRYHYLSPAPPASGKRAEAERYFSTGVVAQQRRQFADAIASYQRAISADPGYYEAYYNKGVAAFQLGDVNQALVANEYALALKPNSANARYNLALSLKAANYPVDAARELIKLLQAHPDDVRAHLALANLYAQQLNQLQGARTHYERVLALNPRHPNASQIRSWLASHPE